MMFFMAYTLQHPVTLRIIFIYEKIYRYPPEGHFLLANGTVWKYSDFRNGRLGVQQHKRREDRDGQHASRLSRLSR